MVDSSRKINFFLLIETASYQKDSNTMFCNKVKDESVRYVLTQVSCIF